MTLVVVVVVVMIVSSLELSLQMYHNCKDSASGYCLERKTWLDVNRQVQSSVDTLNGVSYIQFCKFPLTNTRWVACSCPETSHTNQAAFLHGEIQVQGCYNKSRVMLCKHIKGLSAVLLAHHYKEKQLSRCLNIFGWRELEKSAAEVLLGFMQLLIHDHESERWRHHVDITYVYKMIMTSSVV
ncbi:hypothetical protein EDD85DRAFT_795536 [Armillaria nabsnona]|nr:hypothetical protein EDD85DRAFT_795536 [Armillaria nabsnona]